MSSSRDRGRGRGQARSSPGRGERGRGHGERAQGRGDRGRGRGERGQSRGRSDGGEASIPRHLQINIVDGLVARFRRFHVALAPSNRVRALRSTANDDLPRLHAGLWPVALKFIEELDRWKASREREEMVEALRRQTAAVRLVHKEYCLGLGTMFRRLINAQGDPQRFAIVEGILIQLAQMVDVSDNQGAQDGDSIDDRADFDVARSDNQQIPQHRFRTS